MGYLRCHGADTVDTSRLSAQGNFILTTTVYQENKSTILLAKIGKSPSSKSTRQLNVWYHFITVQIKNSPVKVASYPTQDMLEDFFTKHLQGTACMHA